MAEKGQGRGGNWVGEEASTYWEGRQTDGVGQALGEF